MTATKPALPDFAGHPVDRAAVKITGAGTGLSDALKFAPVALDIGDEAFVLMRSVCAGVEHSEDKDEYLVRTHKLHTEQIFLIDDTTARQMLATAQDKLDRARAEVEGQLSLQSELEAAEREAADADGNPADIAQDAAERVRGGN